MVGSDEISCWGVGALGFQGFQLAGSFRKGTPFHVQNHFSKLAWQLLEPLRYKSETIPMTSSHPNVREISPFLHSPPSDVEGI